MIPGTHCFLSNIPGIVSKSPETPGDVTDDLCVLLAPVHCTGVHCVHPVYRFVCQPRSSLSLQAPPWPQSGFRAQSSASLLRVHSAGPHKKPAPVASNILLET